MTFAERRIVVFALMLFLVPPLPLRAGSPDRRFDDWPRARSERRRRPPRGRIGSANCHE